jgi:hypothetical protein
MISSTNYKSNQILMSKMGIVGLGKGEDRGTGLFIKEGENRGLTKDTRRMMRRRHGRAPLFSSLAKNWNGWRSIVSKRAGVVCQSNLASLCSLERHLSVKTWTAGLASTAVSRLKLPSSDDHEISIMVILSCSCTTRSSLGDSLQNHKGRELSRSGLL